MKKFLWGGFIIIILLCVVIAFVPAPKITVNAPAETLPASPKDAAYILEDAQIFLKNGEATEMIEPGVGGTITTRIFGEPTVGDLDGDGDGDAAVLLQQESGGTGVFYYIAAAINTGGGYQGTNAHFVGDRIAPQTVEIRSGIVMVNYADRGPREPFSTRPSIGKTLYALLNGSELRRVSVVGEGAQLFFGQVTYGGEVRTFTPCGTTNPLWVIGSSPAYKTIFDQAAALATTAAKPYAPMFAVIVGKQVPAPTDGFGADYKGGVYATELVKVVPGGVCK